MEYSGDHLYKQGGRVRCERGWTNLVGFGSESIWVSTFHSACVRILRRYIDRLGYDTNFTIYDADDQKTLMKEVCKYLQIDTKTYRERALLECHLLAPRTR